MEPRPYKAKTIDGKSIIGFAVRTDKGTYIVPDETKETVSNDKVLLQQMFKVDPTSLRIFVCYDRNDDPVFVGDLCRDSANPENTFTIGYEQFSHSCGEVSADRSVWELYIRDRIELLTPNK